MIEESTNFDVGTDSFELCGSDHLQQLDGDFLILNKPVVLCTLQQSLLVKHLFNGSPDKLEDFSFEIYEREAITCEDGEQSETIHCEAVKQVTNKWFTYLLEEMSDPVTNL